MTDEMENTFLVVTPHLIAWNILHCRYAVLPLSRRLNETRKALNCLKSSGSPFFLVYYEDLVDPQYDWNPLTEYITGMQAGYKIKEFRTKKLAR